MVGDHQNENQQDTPESRIQTRLQQAARSFAYPPTPDIAAKERQRIQQGIAARENISRTRRHHSLKRNTWQTAAGFGLALAVVLLLAALLVTPVRARLVEFLRVGAVQIFLGQNPGAITATPPAALTGLAGETSLTEAAEQVPFPLKVPAYPADIGAPDSVYLQQINGTPLVIFAWLNPAAPQGVDLALYQIGEGDVFQKQLLKDALETTVNGQWALWVQGPYLLTNVNGDVEQRRVVTGRTLIWNENGLTYRLETNLPLEEARKIAESLQEWRKE